MAQTESVNEKTVRRTAKQAAKEAAQEAIMELQFGEDSGEGLDLEHLDGNAGVSADANEAAIGFDIFEDIGKPRTEKGEVIRYIVKKYGQHVATKYHPYTWEELRKEFGGGQYQVIARSDSTNRYLKAQTLMLGQNVSARAEDDENRPNREPAPAPQVNWQQPQMSFIELMNLMQNQGDRAREQATQQAQQQAQTQVAMITAMTEMMKGQQAQGQTLFMEMTKMTSQVAKDMSATQEKIMEKMNQRMDKIAEIATKKPEHDGPNWVDVMKMSNDSQNKGFELFEKIMRLAEIKAEEKVELIESARESNNDNDKKKSLTDSLIEGLLPVIASSVARSQQQPQLPQQTQSQLPRQQGVPNQALPRRSIQGQRPSPNGQVRRGPPTPARGTQASGQGTQRTDGRGNRRPVTFSGPTVGPSVVVRPANGAARNSGVVDGPVKVDETITDKLTVESTPTQDVKAKVQEILPVFLGGLMLDADEIPVAAGKTLEFLAENDVSRDSFLASVKVEDLLAVAVQYELPKEAHEWLNGLYAYIQNESRTELGGESTASLDH